MNRIKDKRIVLGVTGSIAAYKAASLCSMLIKQGAKVTVIMTDNATNFVNPITFETLTGEKCLVDTFDRNFKYSVEHVQLAKEADLLIVAPASANMIAKAAHGLADDMLSTTILACDCPKLFAPAMNTRMYLNPVTQDNLATLEKYGMKVITPGSGRLACGDEGEGKLPEPEVLFEHIVLALTEKKLSGKRVLVTAGPTREKIDPVRFISNNSSGKMGYALAKVAAGMGAEVTLVSGITALSQPVGVERVDVESAADMAEAVKSRAADQDIIIKAAAVADYTPSQVYDEKVKKSEGDFSIPLDRTEDILGYLGSHRKENQFLCGFSMETENVIENSKAKLLKKNVDMIVANDLMTPGAGFKGDTNVVTIITADDTKALPLMDKDEVAWHILSEISRLMEGECAVECADIIEEVSAEEIPEADEPVVETEVVDALGVEETESGTAEESIAESEETLIVESAAVEEDAADETIEETTAEEISAEDFFAEDKFENETIEESARVAEESVDEIPVEEVAEKVEEKTEEAETVIESETEEEVFEVDKAVVEPVVVDEISTEEDSEIEETAVEAEETPVEEVAEEIAETTDDTPSLESKIEELFSGAREENIVTESEENVTESDVTESSEEISAEEETVAETTEEAEPEFLDEESASEEASAEDKENESFFDEEFYDEEFADKQDEEKDAADSESAEPDSEFFKDNFEGEVFF